MPGYNIFLRYSRTDSEAVAKLRTRLIDASLRTFLDRYSLPGGKPWRPKPETALGHCRALVVPLSIGGWQHRVILVGLNRPTTAERIATPFAFILQLGV